MIYFRKEIHIQDAAYFFPTSPPSLLLNLHNWKKKKKITFCHKISITQ